MGTHNYNGDVTETFGYCVLSVGSKYPTIEAEVKTINNKLLLSNQRTLNWCRRWDLNPHALKRQILSLLCLASSTTTAFQLPYNYNIDCIFVNGINQGQAQHNSQCPFTIHWIGFNLPQDLQRFRFCLGFVFIKLVGIVGVEPTRVSPHALEACAAASYAICP